MAECFRKVRVNDETVAWLIGEQPIITANHDDDGWAGMDRIEKAIVKIAEHLGIEIVEEESDEPEQPDEEE